MRLMIAEDDPTSRLLLARVLEKLGYEVLQAPGGPEAWELFQRERVRLVITDWMMPDLDGLELCRRIRADVRHARYTYLIVLTALAGKSSFLEAMDAGADDFVSKPFDPDQLLARLRVAERVLSLEADLRRVESLLPICPDCHKVQVDGRWEPLARAASRVNAHPLCPDCGHARVQPAVALR